MAVCACAGCALQHATQLRGDANADAGCILGVSIRIIDSRHAAYCDKWVVDTGVYILSSSKLAYAHALDVDYNMQCSSVGMQTRIDDVL